MIQLPASVPAAPVSMRAPGGLDPIRAALFDQFLERPARILGHRDRIDPFRAYCLGLVLSGASDERKSCEPMAARMAPDRATAVHQALHHFVAKASWNDQAVLDAVRAAVVPLAGPAPVWALHEMVLPKKGNHSVGVGLQRVKGRRMENCQRVVSLWLAGSPESPCGSLATPELVGLPLSIRLFLPAEWDADEARRTKAGIPDHVRGAGMGALALDAVREAVGASVPRGLVIGGESFGAAADLRAGLADLGRPYLLSLAPDTVLHGLGRSGGVLPARDLALAIPGADWHPYDDSGLTWGELPLAGGEKLVALWAEGAPMPEHLWITRLPTDQVPAAVAMQIDAAARVAADVRALKEEVGLAHFEGRGWRGFHHHATLCITAQSFLVWERCRVRQGPAL